MMSLVCSIGIESSVHKKVWKHLMSSPIRIQCMSRGLWASYSLHDIWSSSFMLCMLILIRLYCFAAENGSACGGGHQRVIPP